MVFVLKDLAKLITDFDSVIELLLANEKIETGKIEDSKVDRAPILEFLRSTLHYLNTSNDALIPMEHRPAVFYGAVYLAVAYINQTRWLGSTAKDALLGLIADKSGEVPSVSQLAQFHKGTNIFLTTVYNDNDSRKGLKEGHALNKLSTKHLTGFIRIGYELENSSQKDLMAFIAQSKPSKNSANPDRFRFLRIVPTAIDLNLGSWEKLHTALNSMIQKELGHKHAGTLEKLSEQYPTRARQLSTLLDLREILLSIKESKQDKSEEQVSGEMTVSEVNEIKESKQDKSEEQEQEQDKRLGFTADRKVAILAGTMLLIYEQIKSEIGKWKNSEVYEELKGILEPDAISHQNKEILMATANQFIRFMTIASTSEERAFRENHLFSKTVKFNLTDLLKDFQDKIYAVRVDALEALTSPIVKAEKPTSSWLPSFKGLSLFGAKPSTSDSEEEDDDEEKVTTATTTPGGNNG